MATNKTRNKKEFKVLCINKDHNSSVCLTSSSHLLYYNQEERISRIKRDSGMPLRCLNEVREITDQVRSVVFTGYDIDMISNCGLLTYLAKIGVKFDYIHANAYPHHLSHAFRSFYASGFEEAIVVVRDGRGSTWKFYDGNEGYETTSVYKMSGKTETKINLLYKKIYLEKVGRTKPYQIIKEYEEMVNGRMCRFYPFEIWDDNTEVVLTEEVDVGQQYCDTAKELGYNFHDCGKVMGLAPYGKSDIDLGDPEFSKRAKIAHKVQERVEKEGLDLICEMVGRNYMPREEVANVVLTGGVALNVSANAYYRRNMVPGIKLFVDPLCGDEGNCLGMAQSYSNGWVNQDFDSIYIGGEPPEYDYKKKKWYNPFSKGVESSYVGIEKIVDLLVDGNVVALYQGRAEAGPRALGNRSLLFDPRIKNGKEIVNKIKGRESFRPLGCSIMQEHLDKWFELICVQEDGEIFFTKESPYMMYAFDALEGVNEKVPSVVHVDNTCRLQTVTKEQNDVYWELLNAFNKRVGVPLLGNTSFNLAGQPMVHSVEDAIDVLSSSPIEYLYLPDISQLVRVSSMKVKTPEEIEEIRNTERTWREMSAWL